MHHCSSVLLFASVTIAAILSIAGLLQVANQDQLNCYYAHSQDKESLQVLASPGHFCCALSSATRFSIRAQQTCTVLSFQ